MKQVKKKRFLCIYGSTPDEFQQRMNEALADLHDPEITFPQIPLTAYIMASEWEMVPESLSDAYALRGERYVCENCPYFKRTKNDLRRRWHFCLLENEPTRDDQPACEEFFRQLDSGVIEARGGSK